MSKRFGIFFVTAVLTTALFGCGGVREENDIADTDAASQNTSKNKDVELVVWGAEEDEALLQQIFESFQEEYKEQANFNITFAPQSESGCKDALMADLEAGADVFAFADDQLNTLVAAGALEEVKNYFVLFGGARKRPENQQNFQWIVTSFLYTTTFSIKL